MVVPTEKLSSGKTKKFVGNNQTINMEENISTVKLIGNNCKLTIFRNDKNIKVVGDACLISVRTGSGTVNYIGNNGVLELGEDVSLSKVQCVGNHCRIMKMTNGNLEEVKLPKPKVTKSNSVGCLNLSNRKSVHIGHCHKVCIPYYEISLSVPCLKSQRN